MFGNYARWVKVLQPRQLDEGAKPMLGEKTMRIARPKLNYANVIATLALFVAAGLPKNSVGSKQLKSGAVTKRTLHQKAVSAGKLAPRAVTAGKLAPRSVAAENLSDGIVTAATLAEG